MLWRETERDDRESGGNLLYGQVRVLVVGDSGVGKSSLVHLILKGSAIARPTQTVGCTVGVKHITCGKSKSSTDSIEDNGERDFFVELWDVSGHERYKDCRSLFYTEINGVIFVHDLTERKTKTSLEKWAVEISASGSFSSPITSSGAVDVPVPVPYLVIGNKADISVREGNRRSSVNLVNTARQWIGKQGLLPTTEELPLIEKSFPGNTGLVMAAKEARYDKEALVKFFRMLNRRRFVSNDLPPPSPWSNSLQQFSVHTGETSKEDDILRNRLSLRGESYKYDPLSRLQAQISAVPSTTFYSHRPVSVLENYSLPRFQMTELAENSSNRLKRAEFEQYL